MLFRSLFFIRTPSKASDTYRDQSLQFGVARTGYEVVIDHAGRLHQGVADCRADELESVPEQVATHRIGFGGARGNVGHPPPAVLLWFAADETPEVCVEASYLLAHRKERFRVLDRGGNLQTVSYDAGVAQQPFHVARAITCDFLCAKSSERLPVVLPLLQDRDPAQAGLGAFENEKLEEQPISVHGNAPFFVVIRDGWFSRSPGTTRHLPSMRDGRRRCPANYVWSWARAG
jgi:hypothetical protein